MRIYNEKLLKNFKEHKKINVAAFSDIYKPYMGGVTSVVEAYGKNLSQRCNSVLFCQNSRSYEDSDNFMIVRCKTLPFLKSTGDIPVPQFDPKLEETFKSLNIDIIHIHTFFGLANFALKMAKKYGIPVVYHGHTRLFEEYVTITKSRVLSKILTKRAIKKLNKADEVWTVSNGLKDIYENLGVKVPIKVVQNTTDFTYLGDKKLINDIKKKYNLGSEKILILVARMEIKYKNIGFLIDAIEKLTRIYPKFRMLMVGSGSDLGKIKEIVKSKNLDSYFIFTGLIRDMKIREALYQLSSLLVFPSTYDTFGVVILEAASQKTPTLCIKNTCPAEIIKDEVNGYLSTLDTTEFANHIKKILEDEEKNKEVGERAYHDLLSDKIYDEIIAEYKKIIKNKRGN